MSSDTTHPRPAFSTEQIQTVVERMREEHYRRYRRRTLKKAGTAALALVNLALVLVHPEVVHVGYGVAPLPLPGTAAQFYWLLTATLTVIVPIVARDAIKAWRQRIPPEEAYVEPALEALSEYAEQYIESHEHSSSSGDRAYCRSVPTDAFQEGDRP